MPQYQIAYHPTNKVATVQANNDALPAGAVKIGTFVHDDESDPLGPDLNHVVFHHVRDALYKRSATNPAQAGFWPNNITDMASITIAVDTVATLVPVNTVAPAITGLLVTGSVLTTTNGTWSGSPTYTRQWKRADTADGVGTNIGADATTYTLVAGDVGKYIYCDITATNANGSTVQKSNVIGPSTAA